MYISTRQKKSRGVREVLQSLFVIDIVRVGALCEAGCSCLTVVQEVVEIEVGNGVAGLGPVEKGAPPILEQGVDAAEKESDHVSLQCDRQDAPRPVVGSNLAQGAIDEVNVVLLGNRAAVGLPGAVADNASIELKYRKKFSAQTQLAALTL